MDSLPCPAAGHLSTTHAGGNPEAPTAALFAGDPGQLRRELLRRVKERMDDRAQAGMQADPVRLSMPGFRSRYYKRCFGVEEPTGPELDKAVGCLQHCKLALIASRAGHLDVHLPTWPIVQSLI